MSHLEGPAANWVLSRLGPASKWLRSKLAADHTPIKGQRGHPGQDYCAFFLFAAVAPSRRAQPLPTADFPGRACHLVETGFRGMFLGSPEFLSPEQVSYRQGVEGVKSAEHVLRVYPNGLVELLWILATPSDPVLPLAEMVTVMRRLHHATRTSDFARLHRHRRLETTRRLDWRIGVNGRAVHPQTGIGVPWSRVMTPGRIPEQKTTDPSPSCPARGYAADRLESVRRGTSLTTLLTPVLEELLVHGGYTGGEGIRQCIADVLSGSKSGGTDHDS